MPGRRDVSFDRVDQIVPELDRLLQGHVTVGQWSLGQICNHLAMTFRGSVEGFPTMYPRLLRRTLGPLMFRHLDRTGRMPAGVRAPRSMLPQPGLDTSLEVESLHQATRLFEGHTGAMAENPVMAKLTKDQWSRMQCIHCAHHFSFVVSTRPDA